MFSKYLYFLFLSLMVSLTVLPCFGSSEDISKKLQPSTQAIQHNILSHLLSKTIGTIDSWGVDSLELGLDNGIIAKVIFTIKRTIEKNDKPTGTQDKFLVRDILKIGMRLGVGIVLSGDISLVREYTLVYPVTTKSEGAFHNKFIANLFLPYQVAKNKLPPRYVLMIEDTLEGRGRLNLGGASTFSVGLDSRLSAIHLHRTLYDAKEKNSMLIFDDQANSTKFATELYGSVYGVKMPVLDASLEHGKLVRKYLQIQRSLLDTDSGAADSISLGIWESNLAGIEKYGTTRVLDDTFTEKYFRLSAFGIGHLDSTNREDHFTETLPTSGPSSPAIYEHYELYHDLTTKWLVPGTGEKKFKNIVLTGESEINGKINRASMLLSFRIVDIRTKQNEIGNGYLHMIDTISRNKNFLNFNYLAKNGAWGKTNLAFDVYSSEDNLKRLETVTEQEIWENLALVTAVPKIASSQGRKELAKKLWKNRHILRVVRNVRALVRSLMQYQKNPKAVDQLRALSNAIKEVTYLSESAFSPYGVASLVEILGKNNVYFFAHFAIPDELMGQLPTETVLERERGPQPGANDVLHPFVFNNVNQVYDFF